MSKKRRLLLAQCENLLAAMAGLKDAIQDLSPKARERLSAIKEEGKEFRKEVRKLRRKLDQ